MDKDQRIHYLETWIAELLDTNAKLLSTLRHVEGVLGDALDTTPKRTVE
jgi:hypothetical protein